MLLAEITTSAFGGLLAVLAGIAFCIGGILFKVGQGHNLTPMQILVIAAGVGFLIFIVQAFQSPLGEVPAIVFILAVVAGVSQYFLVLLLRLALKLGPMSAMWCAVSLMFVPVIFYSWLALGQGLTGVKIMSVCAAVACVIAAAEANRRSQHKISPHHRLTYRRAFAYLGLLVGIFLVNGVSAGSQFDLSQRAADTSRTLLKEYGTVYYAAFYATIMASAAIDLAARRKLLASLRAAWWLGILTGLGSAAGMYMAGAASIAIGSISFALTGAAGILAAAVAGTIFFSEKRSLMWYATITLGVAAVVMGNL